MLIIFENTKKTIVKIKKILKLCSFTKLKKACMKYQLVFLFIESAFYTPPLAESGAGYIVMSCVRACISFPGHNFLIHGWILKSLGTNVHQDKTMCRVKEPGPYVKGQGHGSRSNV